MNPDARLRRALGPVDPPKGFAQRVRARVEVQARAGRTAPARFRRRWMAAAAVIVVVLGGPLAWREYDARRDALAARAQVLLALQIASRELNTVHRKVVRPETGVEFVSSEAAGKEGSR
jgi:hypothetical protein